MTERELDAYTAAARGIVPTRRVPVSPVVGAMTLQLDLLSDTPISRRTDPETSKVAAQRITDSGARASQQVRTVAAVREFPGKTSQELAMLVGLDRYVLARRLPELEKGGHVLRGTSRDCQVTGYPAITWWPAKPIPEAA